MKKKETLRHKYGDICWICGRFMVYGADDPTKNPLRFSRDHVPYRRAPGVVIKPAHQVCNYVRGRSEITPTLRKACEMVVRELEVMG